MNCIKNERTKIIMYKNEHIKNEIIKNERIKNKRIKNELIKKRTDPLDSTPTPWQFIKRDMFPRFFTSLFGQKTFFWPQMNRQKRFSFLRRSLRKMCVGKVGDYADMCWRSR